jgi:hypothetical protein
MSQWQVEELCKGKHKPCGDLDYSVASHSGQPNQANVLTTQNNRIRLFIGMVRPEEEYTKSTKLKVHKLIVPL